MCSESRNCFKFRSITIVLIFLASVKLTFTCTEQQEKYIVQLGQWQYFYDDDGIRRYDYQKTTVHNSTIVCSNLTSLSALSAYDYKQKKYDQFLKIHYSNISTLAPLSFSKFTTMKTLHLSNIHITLILPEAFGGLSTLTELYLDNNEITEISKGVYNSLHELQILDLSNNKIKKIEDFALMPLDQLQTLVLSNNHLKEIDDGTFRNLKKLQKLYLNSNLLEKFSFFNATMDFVDLSSNDLKHLELSTHFEIKALNLSQNSISEINNVEILDVTDLDLSSNNLKWINGTCQNLIKFKIANNKIEEIRVLGNSQNIKELDFGSNQISFLRENIFDNLSSLEILRLDNNKISDIKQGLFQDLKNLKVLNLSHNQIKIFYFGTFDNLQNLEILDISHNKLTDLYQYRFVSLNKLSTLYFHDNQIKYFDAKDLSLHLISLKMISLEGNLWQCQDLVNFYHYFRHHNISIKDGHSFDVENLHGIACNSENSVTRDSSEMSSDIEKSINSKLQNLFNQEFQDSSFVQYFEKKYRDSNFFKYFDSFKVVSVDNGSKTDKLISMYKPTEDNTSIFVLVLLTISIVILLLITGLQYFYNFYGIKTLRKQFETSLPQMEMC